jgi:hypothetical protein
MKPQHKHDGTSFENVAKWKYVRRKTNRNYVAKSVTRYGNLGVDIDSPCGSFDEAVST